MVSYGRLSFNVDVTETEGFMPRWHRPNLYSEHPVPGGNIAYVQFDDRSDPCVTLWVYTTDDSVYDALDALADGQARTLVDPFGDGTNEVGLELMA